MSAMGRKRKDSDHGMEPRVYKSHGAYFYVHRDTGRWESLGKELEAANRKARIYNDPAGLEGTTVHWMDQFLIDCEARVKAGTLSAFTFRDYKRAINAPTEKQKKQGALRTFFAPPHTPADVEPGDITEFLELGVKLKRPVSANREKACFSAFMSWLISTRKIPGLVINPCLEASGIKRNPESKRERYVTHEEYREVFEVATRAERLLMELTYRSLQRPESDIIKWDDRVVVTEGGRRYLRFKQNKTGMRMNIAFSPAMDQLLPPHEGTVRKLRAPLVARLDGEHYTYSGLTSMLRRSIAKVNAKRVKEGRPEMAFFGYRDLKGKGATDMYFLAKKPLEEIQHLLGHANKTTSEIYVKARWIEAAEPNMVVMA